MTIIRPQSFAACGVHYWMLLRIIIFIGLWLLHFNATAQLRISAICEKDQVEKSKEDSETHFLWLRALDAQTSEPLNNVHLYTNQASPSDGTYAQKAPSYTTGQDGYVFLPFQSGLSTQSITLRLQRPDYAERTVTVQIPEFTPHQIACSSMYKKSEGDIDFEEQLYSQGYQPYIVLLRTRSIESIKEITVFAERRHTLQPTSLTLSTTDPISSAMKDLSDALATLPSISIQAVSSSAQKPIIRGHQGRRVLTVKNGFIHEGQRWGDDHGLEVGLGSAKHIDVIRGPNALRYSTDGLGGAVLLESESLSAESFGSKRLKGKWNLGLQSNGFRRHLNLQSSASLNPKTALRIATHLNQHASPLTPDYPIDNTGAKELRFSTQAYRCWGRQCQTPKSSTSGGEINIYQSYQSDRYGIFTGYATGTIEGFQAASAGNRPPRSELFTSEDAIERPFQAVRHSFVGASIKQNSGFGIWRLKLSTQNNLRQEFDVVRRATLGPQIELRLQSEDIALSWQDGWQSQNGLSISAELGTHWQQQSNTLGVNGPEVIPAFRRQQFGLYGIAALSKKAWDLRLGARIQVQNTRSSLQTFRLSAQMQPQALVEQERIAFFDDFSITEQCPYSVDSEFRQCHHRFITQLLSARISRRVSDSTSLILDLGYGSRAPNVDELFLASRAPSSPVYGIGNPNLSPERNLSIDLGVSARAPQPSNHFQYSISNHLFVNIFQDYLYFGPLLLPNGEAAAVTTIQGANTPVFAFQQSGALFWGIDGSLSFGRLSGNGFALHTKWSLVNAQRLYTQASDSKFLPRIPALNVQPRIQYQKYLSKNGLLSASSTPKFIASIQARYTARQHRFSIPETDLAPAPGDYTLFDASVRLEQLRGVWGNEGFILVSAHNLLNRRYRSYTSLQRYFTDAPGLNLKAAIGSTW